MLANTVATIARVKELFSNDWTTSAEVYLPHGEPPVPGERFSNPALARTYRRLLEAEAAATGGREAGIDAARRAWREGFVAEAVDAFAKRPFQHPGSDRYPGVITGADLAGFTPAYEDTARATFRDMTVHKTRALGPGPVLLQQLTLLDGYPDEEIDVSTEAGVHLAVEAGKLAYADREAWYGDAIEPPLDALLHPDYVRDRRKLIGDEASLGYGRDRPTDNPHDCPSNSTLERPAGRSVSPLWTSAASRAATPAISMSLTAGGT